MSDKNRTVLGARTVKPKRPSTVSSTATSSRTKIVPKEKVGRDNFNKEQVSLPDFDAEYRQIAYGKFMRAMLEECLVEEKIEREETQLDLQMTQLADRFKKTMNVLDKTNRRLKDISFVVEQKRLLDLKSSDSTQFYETTDKSNAESLLQDLSSTEQACLDKIELHNVDFGFNKKTGHNQLLDAVNDAIEGLETIKKESKLDINKFAEYNQSKVNIEEIDKSRLDLESLRSEFEDKFPKMNEQLLQEASEKIARLIENDEDDE